MARISRANNKLAAARAFNTRPRAIALAVSAALVPWTSVHALPSGWETTLGTVSHSQTSAQAMHIDVKTQHAATSYRGGFSIGAPETVNITQLGRDSVFLIRDISGNPTNIFGSLTANGQIFLSNSNGVLFGRGAQVEVGAMFATTLSMNDEQFKNGIASGRYLWAREGAAGSVVNEGSIVTANGYTALVGPQVRNDGIIVAHRGNVALAAGDRVALDLIGDGLISISVDQAAMNASVVNTGTIEADGGRVLLTARSANALLDTVINSGGVIRAHSLSERNGEIVLDGGSGGVVSVTGTLQAAGTSQGATGGTIKVLGDKVGLFGDATLNASGEAGGGTVLVGGNWQGSGPERNATAAFMSETASIYADGVTTGDGGTVVLWSDGSTKAYGRISARGGSQSGNGGAVETSGHYLDVAGARIDTRAANGVYGSWLLDPYDITIVDGAAAGSTGGAFGGVNPKIWTASATGSSVTDADIEANLVLGSVIITTVNAGGAESGDITVNSGVSISWLTTNTLTLNAERNITVLGNATFTSAGGTLAFNVGQAGNGGTLTTPGTATFLVGTVNATGGAGADTFNIGKWGLTGSITGSGSNDTFNINTSITANLVGGAGDDAFVFADGAMLTGSVDGQAGADTLNLSAYATALTIALDSAGAASGANGTTSGIPNPVSGGFSNIDAIIGGSGGNTFNVSAPVTANLTGGNGADTFNLSQALTGTVAGGSGGDTLQGAALSNGALNGSSAANGFDGSITGISGGFTGINALIGSGTLIGRDVTSTWVVDAGTYSDGTATLSHSGFGTLQGGTAVDTFNVNAAVTKNLAGGGGVDVFNLDAALTGTIDGQAAGGTLDGTQVVNATLTGASATTGFSGSTDASALVGSFSNITAINGNGGGKLTGLGTVSTWDVDAGSYTDTVSGRTLSHSGFATLQGGSAVDTFTLSANATANLAGGAGADVFSLGGNTLTGSIDGELAGGTITGIGNAALSTQGAATGFNGTSTNVSAGFNNITSLSGTGTLTGRDVTSTWELDGTPTYSDGTRTLDIAGFANLQGGSAADIFNVSAPSVFNLLGGAGADAFNINAALTGTVTGQGNTDTLQGTQIGSATLTGSTAADGFTGTTTGVTGFSGIDVLNGTGTLTGRNVTSTWAVDAGTYSDGTATLSHSGFGTLQGGTAVDTFNVSAAVAKNLAGGDGGDAFNVNAPLTGLVDGQAGSDTLTGSTTYVVSGPNSGTASNVSGGWSAVENLVGTAGADTFTLAGGALDGSVNGLGGTDSLTADNVSNTWTITGTNSGTLTGTGGWSDVENLVGGTSSDSFIGSSGGSVAGSISDAGGGTTTLSGALTSGGAQSYTGAVSLSSATTLTSSGGAAISFASTVNGAQTLAVNTSGLTTFGGAVGGSTALASLTTGSGGTTQINGGSVITTGLQTYGEAVSLGIATVLQSTGGGAIALNGTVNGAAALTVTAVNISASNVTTSGAQQYNGNATLRGTYATSGGSFGVTGAALLASDTTINTGSGNVTFGSTIDSQSAGGSSLTVNDSGTNSFGGAIGATTALANITTDQPGLSTLNGNVTVTGSINFLDVTTANGVRMTSTGGGEVTVNGANTGSPAQVSTSGNVTFHGANIGTAGSPLAFLVTPNALTLTQQATAFFSGPSIPGSVVFPAGSSITYNNALIAASFIQQQAANAASQVGSSITAVIVEEANKTFGTDSVAEDVEYGFAGEIGATPPMDHRIGDSGISVPRCLEEARESLPCK